MKDTMNNILNLVFEDFLCVTLLIMSIVFTPVFLTSVLMPFDTGMLTETSGVTALVSIMMLSIVVKINQHTTRMNPIYF